MGFGALKDFIQKPACETQGFYLLGLDNDTILMYGINIYPLALS